MAEPAPVSLALAVAVVLAAVVAAKLTAWMREYALRAGIQDVPNERSSHTVPTPRGGGVSLVVVVATALGGALVWWPEEWRWLAASLVGVVAIASFGFLDDRSPLPARTRFLVQLACAAGVLFARGGQFDLELGFGLVLSGWAANVFAVLYLVWMTNLFNFMDGIDGIAGVQAAAVALGLLVLMPFGALVLVAAALLGASLGFLRHNWSPASIFMGDVGSAPIGFLIGVLGLWAASRDVPFVSTLILSGVFIVDATYTLLRRLSRGDRVWQAHRSHAYQRAAARWGHARVSMAVAVFDATVAIPASVLVYLYPRFSGLVGALVGVVLLVTVISLRAGEER